MTVADFMGKKSIPGIIVRQLGLISLVSPSVPIHREWLAGGVLPCNHTKPAIYNAVALIYNKRQRRQVRQFDINS
jgi:hypothetical protein